MQDPLPGHETHQIVIALPLGDDGKMYSVQVTYSASKPVQVVVLIHLMQLQQMKSTDNR